MNIYTDLVNEITEKYGLDFDDEYSSAYSNTTYLKFVGSVFNDDICVYVYIDIDGYITSYKHKGIYNTELLDNILYKHKKFINRTINLSKIEQQ